MSEREKAIYKRGRVFYVAGVGILFDYGTSVPTDGTADYATGCLYQKIDGTGDTVWYVNQGTLSSCDFNAMDVGDITAASVDIADAGGFYTGTTVEAALAEVGGTDYANRFTVSTTLAGTAAATGANYGKFFVAPRACTVTKISEVHTTAGSDGSAVTLSVERLQGTETSGNGDDLLGATKIDLKGTAETVQSPALTGTTASLTLAAGDRLNLVDTGTLTAVAGVCVTVELEWVVS